MALKDSSGKTPGKPVDIKSDVSDMLNGRKSTGQTIVMDDVHNDILRLVHAQSLDHQLGIMGKPDCNADKVKEEIYAKCKQDLKYRKEYGEAHAYMIERYHDMRKQDVLLGDADLKNTQLALKKSDQLKSLVNHMEQAKSA